MTYGRRLQGKASGRDGQIGRSVDMNEGAGNRGFNYQ
jgi:hypothetical protein